MSQNTRHLVDPELLDYLNEWPTLELSTESLPKVREMWRQGTLQVATTPAAADVRVSSLRIKGPKDAPDVGLRVYQSPARSSATGAILYIHGGGYVGGDAAVLEPLHRQLVADLGCVLISVDYRWAPETRFPGNIEDCYAALSWVFGNAHDLRINAHKIGVMGESAGGGLAAALALLARDRGEFELAFQHLFYPMIDDRTCVAADPNPFAGEFVWNAQSNRFGWSALLGLPPGSEAVSPYAAAARAEHLEGLPPTFLATAALDLFIDENLEYARRLTRAGVPVELHVYPGAFHGFDYHPTAKVAVAARRDSLAALARFLG